MTEIEGLSSSYAGGCIWRGECIERRGLTADIEVDNTGEVLAQGTDTRPPSSQRVSVCRWR